MLATFVILHGLLEIKEIGLVLGKSLSDLGYNGWLVDDLRNHGDSEWNDQHTYIDLAEDVRNFLKNMEWGPVLL